MDRVAYARTTNGYVTDYVKFGDTKAGALLGLVGVLVGGLVGSAPAVFAAGARVGKCLESASGAVLSAAVLAATVCAWHCVAALSPNVRTAASLNSFPDIAALPESEYIKRVNALADDASLADEYSRHNWTLSKIAQDKFGHIRQAVVALRVAIITAAAYAALAGIASFLAARSQLVRSL